MRTAVLLTLSLLLPVVAYAALININTADATLLDTLPGIGPVYAARIVDYRTVHGPFARIEDIQNVSGIGPSTYANIKSLITVGDSSASSSSASNTNASSTPDVVSTAATPAAVPPDNGPPEYLPIPTLYIVANDSRTVSSGADTAFTAAVYDGRGNKRDDAIVTWSFGDGMRKTGASVFHQYYNPGEYLAIVRATTADGGDAQSEIVVTVKDASIKISSVSSRGIALTNSDSRTLDVSFWRLSAGGQEFKIPEDTHLLAGHTILFPAPVIELPLAGSASLLYPSGEVAATYPPIPAPQPSSSAVSYTQVSEVEPAISARADVPIHEEAGLAPIAAAEPAAVGAASVPAARTGGIFKSPWTLGLLGVIMVAGGAFIFL